VPRAAPFRDLPTVRELRVAAPELAERERYAANDTKMSQIADILDAKGRDVFTIAGTATVFEAIEKMVEANVGALLVDDGGGVLGIMTERDYLRRVTLQGRDERTTPVREIMSSPVIYVTPETEVEECMALMTERRIRHVPVVADDDLVGVISIGDLVKFRSREQSFQIRYLTEYITAR
jgi:CBS domain-containing protein